MISHAVVTALNLWYSMADPVIVGGQETYFPIEIAIFGINIYPVFQTWKTHKFCNCNGTDVTTKG